ncbi:MAG: hypothetical protein AMJ54_06590 [Deltaproteobacteria bacterium SG8_13]|nr:MAG: hypothetical protein AMJ54_06590 [Deltaproteobacteria bacterium SG8_13]
MDKVFQLLLGVALAVLFISFAKAGGHRRELQIYCLGLVVAALLYVAFSVTVASYAWLMIEIIGAAIFTLVAVLGLRVSPWFLSLGWAAHILWDVLLHLVFQQAFVPSWYPVVCVSFDITVAGTIALKLRKRHQ